MKIEPDKGGLRIQMPKVRFISLQELTRISPPAVVTKENALSNVPGVVNNGLRENVFEAKILIERVYAVQPNQVYVLLHCTAENGFSMKTVIPVKQFSDRDFERLKAQVTKKKVTVLYRDNDLVAAALDSPITIQTNLIDLGRFGDAKAGQATKREFSIRSIAKKKGGEPDIFQGYLSLTSYGEKMNTSILTYLTPETIRGFGSSGTFENMPFLPIYISSLKKPDFPEETYKVIGENGKEVDIKFNAYSNMRIHLPLKKPTEEQIANPDLPLGELAPLKSIPQHLWRRYLDTVFKGQYIESIDALELGLADDSDPKKRDSGINETGPIQELGEIYDGPRKTLKVRGEFLLFEVSLTSGKTIFIVDSPLYGRALHAFHENEKAEDFIRNYGTGNNTKENEAFCIYHTTEWKKRLVEHIKRLND